MASVGKHHRQLPHAVAEEAVERRGFEAEGEDMAASEEEGEGMAAAVVTARLRY